MQIPFTIVFMLNLPSLRLSDREMPCETVTCSRDQPHELYPQRPFFYFQRPTILTVLCENNPSGQV